MKTQEEIIKAACYLFFCPDMWLGRHDVSVTTYFVESDNQSKISEFVHMV